MLNTKLFFIGFTCGISTVSSTFDRDDYQEKNIFQNKELEIRYFGWGLLGLWIGAIVYMTRDFFFPSIFGKKEDPSSRAPAEEVRRFSHMMTIVEEAEESTPPIPKKIIKKKFKEKGEEIDFRHNLNFHFQILFLFSLTKEQCSFRILIIIHGISICQKLFLISIHHPELPEDWSFKVKFLRFLNVMIIC